MKTKWQYFIAPSTQALYRYNGERFEYLAGTMHTGIEHLPNHTTRWVKSPSYELKKYDPSMLPGFKPISEKKLFLLLL